MDENVSIKHAVYINKDGKDVLEVVRDTPEQAKADMEKLKSQSSRIRIEKANIQNFGKDGEKIVSSQIIESWDSADGNKGAMPVSGAPDSMKPPIVPPMPTPPPIDTPVEPKKDTWQDHYGKHGALFWAEGWEELTKPKPIKTETPVMATTTTAIDSTVGSTMPPAAITTPMPDAQTTVPMPVGSIAPPISDMDIDKIAEKLKEKLSQNNNIQSQPQIPLQKPIGSV